MSEHFIKEIEIKNFKCFKDFKAKGFGRVNLIGGKNNVGKRAFMEACYVNVHSKNIYNLIDALGNITLRRDKLNFLLDNFRGRNSEPLSITTQKYHFMFQEIEENVNIRDFSYRRERIDNIKFLDNFGLSKKNIIDTYKSIDNDKVKEFIENKLSEFNKNITGMIKFLQEN